MIKVSFTLYNTKTNEILFTICEEGLSIYRTKDKSDENKNEDLTYWSQYVEETNNFFVNEDNCIIASAPPIGRRSRR